MQHTGSGSVVGNNMNRYILYFYSETIRTIDFSVHYVNKCITDITMKT